MSDASVMNDDDDAHHEDEDEDEEPMKSKRDIPSTPKRV